MRVKIIFLIIDYFKFLKNAALIWILCLYVTACGW